MTCCFLFTKNMIPFLLFSSLFLSLFQSLSWFNLWSLHCPATQWHAGGGPPLAWVCLLCTWGSFHHIPVILFLFIWCCDVYLSTSSFSCILPLLSVVCLCVFYLPPTSTFWHLFCLIAWLVCLPVVLNGLICFLWTKSKPVSFKNTVVRTRTWFEQSNCRGLFRILVIIKFTKTMLLIYHLNPTFVVTVLTTIFVSDFPLLTKVLTNFVHLLPPTPFECSLALHRKQTFPFFLVLKTVKKKTTHAPPPHLLGLLIVALYHNRG